MHTAYFATSGTVGVITKCKNNIINQTETIDFEFNGTSFYIKKRPGVTELFRALKTHGIRTNFLTTGSANFVKTALDSVGIFGYDSIIDKCDERNIVDGGSWVLVHHYLPTTEGTLTRLKALQVSQVNTIRCARNATKRKLVNQIVTPRLVQVSQYYGDASNSILTYQQEILEKLGIS